MNIFLALGLILAGIVCLYFGGDYLIDNAAKLAKYFGVSTLFIGLTVVAFGTSAPELAAALTAAFQDAPNLVMGNIIGSNIANLALVMGIAALIYPIATTRSFVRREVPFMIGTSLLLLVLTLGAGADGLARINRLEGLLLFGLLVGYVVVLLRSDEQSEIEEVAGELEEVEDEGVTRPLLFAALGAALLVAGAQLLVAGAVGLAEAAGVPERIIGITLVAVGTSLPELAASVAAALKKEGDIILGNLIGSNIFNVLSIIGITSMAVPLNVPPELYSPDFWTMIGVSVIVGLFLAFRLKFTRIEGLIVLAIYAVYIGYIAVGVLSA